MKKIVMLPLDERPCNFDFPQMMPKADYQLVLPPKEYMGDKKIPADTDRLAGWLLENIEGADACILSMDTLIYGGIVPSRLHHEELPELFRRAATVEALRKKNPTMQFYVFQLIMRCPDYSLSDEEPDYYDLCGRELHLYGRYTHKEKLGILTEEDKADFERVKKAIPPDVLADFVGRREKNRAVIMHDLEYVRNGTVDYFIVPQDDAAVYGFTTMDQAEVRKFLKANSLHLKTAMYPSADDTGLILLGRAVAKLGGITPKIYVKYASSKAAAVVPWFEDRVLDETIKYHIMAVGGQRVYSLPEADILLAINQGSGMWYPDQAEYSTAYDIERNLGEFVSYIEYALREGKLVAVGDVAFCNGGDEEFVRLMHAEGIMLKIHAYAGWNTSSNSIGTTVCQAVLYMAGRDDEGNRSFLLHRYYEDVGYMPYVKQYVTDTYLPGMGLDYFHADGKDGKVAQIVREEMDKYMAEHYPDIHALVDTLKVEMPWRRMFEADVKLTVKKGV